VQPSTDPTPSRALNRHPPDGLAPVVLEPEVRTINFNSLLQYVAKRMGEEAVDQLLSAVDLSRYRVHDKHAGGQHLPLTRDILCLDGDYWVSHAFAAELFAAAEALLPDQDPLFKAGRHFVRNLPAIRKRLALVKLVSPALFFARASRENSQFNRTKTLEVESSRTHVAVKTIYLPQIIERYGERLRRSKPICNWYRGAVHMYLELMGLSQIEVVEERCITQGGDHCLFRATFTPVPFLRRLKNSLFHWLAADVAADFEGLIEERDQVVFALERIVAERTEKLVQANRKLEELSFLDDLTRIPNRRYFNEFLAKEWGYRCRTRSSLGLIMCDVDHFKRVNDRFGHPTGDACLKAIADRLQLAARRANDFAARFGGEELAVVLPDATLQSAREIAERLRADIEAMPLGGPDGTSYRVTVSLGVAVAIPEPGIPASTLVEAADRALYRAKQTGRNRVEVEPMRR
jgi:diguanylate cyclase (GGDEF)-like protein